MDTRRPAGLSALVEQDEQGIITGWSPTSEALFGWSCAEAVGRPSNILIPPRNYARHEEELARVLRGREAEAYVLTITMRRRDGSEFKGEVAISVLPRPGGRTVVGVIREVAAQKGQLPDDARFRAILDQIQDPCTVTDLAGRYIFVNEAFCRTFSRTRDEVLGTRFVGSSVVGGQKFREIYSEVYDTGRPNKGFEYRADLDDGTVRYFEQSVSLERDKHGRPIGFLAIARDCTARRQAEEETARAREAAEEANRAKSEFLANMSHEIRTPMNGIIGMTELVLDTELTPHQRESLVTVRTSAESLLTILNEILDFSKIESRKVDLECVPFSLIDAIDQTLRPLALHADTKGLDLIADVSPAVPSWVVGDPVRLRQVLTNLIGNALKFTERGHIALAVSVRGADPDRATLGFAVTDTGIGIPAGKHATVFEAFSQADGSTTRRFGGTGLGLAISARLVSLMGGRIELQSEPGQGSTFSFALDFALAEPPRAPASTPAGHLTGLRVLIADDNAVNRRILDSQVSAWGMRATTVGGGRAAVEALLDAAREGRPYSLVLLDANMPDVDGFDAAKEIAAHPEITSTTVMMLSSSGEYGDVERCRALGIADYLVKPIRQAELQQAVYRALQTGSAVTAAPRRAKPLTGRALNVLLAEDNIVNQRVAVGLLTRRGHRVTVAATGREAVAAFESGPFDLVLMDVQMPDMSGFEATAAIRALEAGSGTRIRIVAMTAHAMTGDREKCLEAGMDGYLSKPVNPARLYQMVEEESAPAILNG